MFKLTAPFAPTGDQPAAIASLVGGVRAGRRWQTLLGVTGSGKTFTIANVIAELDRPTLVFSHNKTLAAQLYGELKGFFPGSAVEYFISPPRPSSRPRTRTSRRTPASTTRSSACACGPRAVC